MSGRRDSGKGKLYAAENVAEQRLHELGLLSHRQLDGTLPGAQRYVDRVTSSAWWGRNVTRKVRLPVEVQLGERMSGGWASYSLGHPVVLLGGRARRFVGGTACPAAIANPIIVLHELAHVAAGGSAGHGREFARMELALVRRFMGRQAWGVLRQAFTDGGVKTRQPSAASSRPGNPEALAAFRKVADGEWIVAAELLPCEREGGWRGVWRDRSTPLHGQEPLTFYVRDIDSERLLTSTDRGRARVWKMRESAERWAERCAADEGARVTGWRVEPLS